MHRRILSLKRMLMISTAILPWSLACAQTASAVAQNINFVVPYEIAYQPNTREIVIGCQINLGGGNAVTRAEVALHKPAANTPPMGKESGEAKLLLPLTGPEVERATDWVCQMHWREDYPHVGTGPQQRPKLPLTGALMILTGRFQ